MTPEPKPEWLNAYEIDRVKRIDDTVRLQGGELTTLSKDDITFMLTALRLRIKPAPVGKVFMDRLTNYFTDRFGLTVSYFVWVGGEPVNWIEEYAKVDAQFREFLERCGREQK